MRFFEGKLRKDADAVGVIIAGGQGTRFWPLSRESKPKQFLMLDNSGRTLIQLTSDRLQPLVSQGATLVVTGVGIRGLVREQLPDAAVLSEPVPRNTAAAVGYAAVAVLEHVGDVPMAVMPADHLISGDAGFRKTFDYALQIARDLDVMVTLGIKPNAPETGYGYIKVGATIEENLGSDLQLLRVEKFVEKPKLETAQRYLESGEYFWNSGMFVWRPSVILAAIRRHLPKLADQLDEVRAALAGDAPVEHIEAAFLEMQSVSVDVGVLERADNVTMIAATGFAWSDVGSWSAWYEELVKTADCKDGNVAVAEGVGEAIFEGSKRCGILSDGRLVAAVGVEDLIIVDTPEAVLVCRRDKAQEVKRVVEALRAKKKTDLL